MFGLIVGSSAPPWWRGPGAVVVTRKSRCPCGWAWPVPMTMETCWWRWSRKQIKNGSGTYTLEPWNPLGRSDVSETTKPLGTTSGKLWHSCLLDIYRCWNARNMIESIIYQGRNYLKFQPASWMEKTPPSHWKLSAETKTGRLRAPQTISDLTIGAQSIRGWQLSHFGYIGHHHFG